MAKSNKMLGRDAQVRAERKTQVVRKPKVGGASARQEIKIKTKAPSKSSKVALIKAMLCRAKGTTVTDLCSATAWQPHSVRAAISQTIKKKLRLDVRSEKLGATRVYRVKV